MDVVGGWTNDKKKLQPGTTSEPRRNNGIAGTFLFSDFLHSEPFDNLTSLGSKRSTPVPGGLGLLLGAKMGQNDRNLEFDGPRCIFGQKSPHTSFGPLLGPTFCHFGAPHNQDVVP